jgi:hypothetical protein
MTICVAVKIQDCIVFAADSTSSLQTVLADGNPITINTYDHANKVFNVRKGLPIAAMTAGIENFGPASISTITKDFRALLSQEGGPYYCDPHNYTIEQVATLARQYFFTDHFQKLHPAPSGTFQYWIGGYSSGEDLGEVWRSQIDTGVCCDPICDDPKEVPSSLGWGGATEAINRLVLGYGQGMGQALAAGGVEAANLPQAIAEIGRYTHAELVHPAMPTVDAVKLARV